MRTVVAKDRLNLNTYWCWWPSSPFDCPVQDILFVLQPATAHCKSGVRDWGHVVRCSAWRPWDRTPLYVRVGEALSPHYTYLHKWNLTLRWVYAWGLEGEGEESEVSPLPRPDFWERSTFKKEGNIQYINRPIHFFPLTWIQKRSNLQIERKFVSKFSASPLTPEKKSWWRPWGHVDVWSSAPLKQRSASYRNVRLLTSLFLC